MAKKCANCILCEYNTNVDGYVEGAVVEGFNDRQIRALGIIAQAAHMNLTGQPDSAFCLGDHHHFLSKSNKNKEGKVVISFFTRQQSKPDCFMCKKLNKLIQLEGGDGSSSP